MTGQNFCYCGGGSTACGAFVVTVLILAAALQVSTALGSWGNVYIGTCQQQCCCKVCSSSTMQAFPYGVTSVPISGNPSNPQVAGATCHIPVWSDAGPYATQDSSVVAGPNTLYWSSYPVFGDFLQHVAPTTCDCCKFSVDTTCAEVAPVAQVPTSFTIPSTIALEGQYGSIQFNGGVQLSNSDYAELRNDTHCGYGRPRYLMRSAAGAVTPDATGTYATWNITKLPNHGCYRVCYFHANLTTPGWYYIGDVTINKQQSNVDTYFVDPNDVLLETNTVTLTFYGPGLLDVVNDRAELRTTVTACGGASPVVTTVGGASGSLAVPAGVAWCQPAVVPQITSLRPLNYIAVQYTDCPVGNRLLVSRLQWYLTLPTAGTYKVCYMRNGTWRTSGSSLVVPARATLATAMNTLYTATAGTYWKRKQNWPPGTVCALAGVRCDASSKVVKLLLSGNNMTGTLPASFFTSTLFQSITHLSLSYNHLSGTLPREIGVLRNLLFLDLSGNNFTGTIPATLQRASLQGFYFSENNFSGSVPSSFSALSMQWTQATQIVPTVVPPVPVVCPAPTLQCPATGESAVGVTQCGTDGITQSACLAYGCCFNQQAALTFGGSSCFTKQDSSAATHPPCQNGKLSCVVQYVAPS